tara:strand:+ start:413 stop:1225 length:813 start_codon:yes stop_codon:yes gene_type:complete
MALFNWDYDVGNKGDFGGADYIEGLKKGGTSTEKLKESRLAIKDWVNQATSPTGKEGGHGGIDWTKRSAFWDHDKIKKYASGDTGVGYTGFADHSRYATGDRKDWKYEGEKKGGDYWYTEADWLGGRAAGHSNKAIRDWLTGDEGKKRIYKDSDILQRVTAAADEDITAEHTKKIESLKTSHLGKLDTMEQERDAAEAATKTLTTKYDKQLKELKQAKAAVRSNKPTAVTGGGAMSIGFQQGPRRTANLQSLTRARPSASSKLKVKTLNI